ncbi:Ulp1 protease family, carboxy-terminal domain protein [Arachis hypogaea]|nr:Ulp1 protease family, carboxy-terminal domain protein [Arachis hypogaea]
MKFLTLDEQQINSMKDKSTLLNKEGDATDVDVSLASVVAKGADDGGRSLEEKMLTVLNTVQEHVLEDREVTKTILKTHNDQLWTMTDLLADHGKAIQSLISLVNTRGYDQVGEENSKAPLAASLRTGKRNPGKVNKKLKDPPEKQSSRGRKLHTQRTRSNEKLASSTKRKPRRCTVKRQEAPSEAATGKTKAMSMKRKLTFENLDSTSSAGSDLKQTEPGTPFTYHTHHGHHGAEDMPRCFNLSFRPPEGMHFVGKELAVAAYIFSSDLDKREVLVHDDNSRGDRDALLTLRPGQMIVDDVINLACTMLTHENRKESWFLPTTFFQVALSPVNHNIDTFEFIRNRDNHWFLMVVDLVNYNLLYLNSAKDGDRRDARVSQMKFVAFFLENMLEDKRFWKNEEHFKPHPSTFDVTEPPIGQQAEGSLAVHPLLINLCLLITRMNDCGVWVCQWMMLNWVWGNVDLEDVNNHTRMRLALDLVIGPYNPIAHDVGRRAVRHWDIQMQRSTKKEKKGRKKIAMAADSPSQSITI